ncbi:MAG TPA: helix-turn-helix domain-containing protein [Syntrophales bacterium]|nr:helix-turn-helix domain-containing protein [Syntrophales bacterium]
MKSYKAFMIVINRQAYFTTIDAAVGLGVSTKTIREYIKKGIIPPPPEIRHGVRLVKHFPHEYMESAKALLERHRKVRILGSK